MDSNKPIIIDPNTELIRDICYKFSGDDLKNIRLEYFKTIYLKDLLYAFDEEPFEFQEKCINILPDHWDRLPEGKYDIYELKVNISWTLLSNGAYKIPWESIPVTVGVLIIREDEARNVAYGQWKDLGVIEDFCYYPHTDDVYLKLYTSKVHGTVSTSYLKRGNANTGNEYDLNDGCLIEHSEGRLYSCKFKLLGRNALNKQEQAIIGITLGRSDTDQISAIYFFDTGGMLSE